HLLGGRADLGAHGLEVLAGLVLRRLRTGRDGQPDAQDDGEVRIAHGRFLRETLNERLSSSASSGPLRAFSPAGRSGRTCASPSWEPPTSRSPPCAGWWPAASTRSPASIRSRRCRADAARR